MIASEEMGSHPSKGVPKHLKEGEDHNHSEKNNNTGDQEEHHHHHHHHLSMPSFKKMSTEAKKRLQHQMYLAQESPEPTFDISNCQVYDVPAGVFSQCKVFRKEALLLHNNHLSSLKGGGKFGDLENIRVLDLHRNEISHLPDDMGVILKRLQILNVEHNKLKSLPPSIGGLDALQTLNLKKNKLHDIPPEICNLKSLRTLDISENHIKKLPKNLCHVRTLENIILDAPQMQYPTKDICLQGTEAIMKFLCKDCDIDYIPPSQFVLDVLDSPVSPTQKKQTFQAEFDPMSDTVMQYERMKEKKRQERIALEKQMEDEQRKQAELAAKAMSNKQHLISYMAQDQQKMHAELSGLQQQKDHEHRQLVNALTEAERNADNLVKQLLEMAEKAQKTEEILEKMERERMEQEQWFIVRQEEMENLRKKEMLEAMEKILAQNAMMDKIVERCLADQNDLKSRAKVEAVGNQELLDLVLNQKLKDQSQLLAQLLQQENTQKEAFEALMMQKDAKHKRITSQIELIQQELMQLTVLEVEQRELKMGEKINILAEKRHNLAELLTTLLQQKEQREEQLKQRLIEMEEQKLSDQTDYWMVQFQRLIDMKPQALIDAEKQLEFAVVDILERASAQDYVSKFARHRISIETMCQLNEDDLKQMGVYELGLRRSILTEIEKYKLRQSEEKAARKLKKLDSAEDEFLGKPGPSTVEVEPTPGTSEPGAAASAPPLSNLTTPPREVAARLTAECVICMDNVSVVLFLNCGHICCCKNCSDPLKECPLCRGTIVQRITMGQV